MNDKKLADMKAKADAIRRAPITMPMGQLFNFLNAPQSNSAKKPRPKKTPTHRNEVIAAMRPWRKVDGESFKAFLTAADNANESDNVNYVTITPSEDKPGYIVECPSRIIDSVGNPVPKEVSEKRLLGWWTEAAKKSR